MFLPQPFPGDSPALREDPKPSPGTGAKQRGDTGTPPAPPWSGEAAQTFGSFYLLQGNFPSSRSGLFVFHPDRHKMLCNIQEVTSISLNSIYKIKSMEKQILLDGKRWHWPGQRSVCTRIVKRVSLISTTQ